MTDYTDWTRTPIRFEDVQKGDGIHIDGGEVELICLNSPTLVGAGDEG